MNIGAARALITALHRAGVSEICLCPGGRNSPLVAQLEVTTGMEVHSFFDERAAAFFALGVARWSGRRAAVVTTSGTAVGELMPAMMEGYHVGAPLIAVTADRPRRMRGTGAPQSLDQVGLFSRFVGWEVDVEAGEAIDLTGWDGAAPAHLNICFDEPLLDEPVHELTLGGESEGGVPVAGVPPESGAILREFLGRGGTPLVVVAGLEREEDRAAVRRFLRETGALAWLEASSGLREDAALRAQTLTSSDGIVSRGVKAGLITAVLRVGGVPTTRLWRDLEDPRCAVPVLSVSDLPFPGLSRGELLHGSIAGILGALTDVPRVQVSEELCARDRAAGGSFELLFERYPRAESTLMRDLSAIMSPAATVYLGNSLPIREWELAATRAVPRPVRTSRGVNGIDGQISTFLGGAAPGSEQWAILGDLTALYDLQGLWGGAYRRSSRLRLAVMNNGGGRIFTPMFGRPIFENRHHLSFDQWAAMFGWRYERWERIGEAPADPAPVVIEIVPDEEESARFTEGLRGLWQNE